MRTNELVVTCRKDAQPWLFQRNILRRQSRHRLNNQQVRKILGEDAIILANSGGAVSDPSLSGITIEMESCVGTLSQEVSVSNHTVEG